MKKCLFVLCLLFAAATFAGAGYVLANGGTVNAGYAVIPMLMTLVLSSAYRRSGKNS